jgi:hypothetical protein
MTKPIASHTLLWVALFGAFSFNALSSARASEHRYVAWSSDASESECESRVAVLEKKFETLSGLTVTESTCGAPVTVTVSQEKLSFRPMYLFYRKSGSPLAIYSAFFGAESSRDRTGVHHGAFGTFSECMSKMSALSTLTERETGLPVLSASCLKAQSLYSGENQVFTLQVDAIVENIQGKTQQKSLFTQTISTSSTIQFFPESLIRDLSDRLKKAGATLAHQQEGGFWYFAKNPLPFTVWPVFGVATDGACELQKSRFQSILSQLGGNSQPSFHCVERTAQSKGFQLGVGIWMGRRSAGLAPVARESYTSLKDCLSDLPRLDRNLPEFESLKKTLGYICVGSTSSMNPFSEFEARGIEVFQ